MKIIGNVVYSRCDFKSGKSYYTVVDYGANDAEAEKMTEIYIVDEIDGIPVTSISGFKLDSSYDDDVCQYIYEDHHICPNVTKITIPESVTSIGKDAFSGLTNLSEIVLPKNLTRIGSSAFRGLEKLTQIVIPKKVRWIEANTFKNCTGLKKVVIEGDILGIRQEAFYNCKSLEAFPDCTRLKYINNYAFYGCTKLKSINLPDTLKYLGYGAFGESGLTSVTIPPKADFESYDEDHWGGDYGIFGGCKNLKTVTFKDCSDEIYITENAFRDCTALEKVVLPKSAMNVGLMERAFYNCSKLKSIVNAGRIDYIGEAAFANCTSLESIKFSSKIKIISSKAFYGCKKLSSVTFTDKENVAGASYKKPNSFDAKTFTGTPDGIKFYVKNTTVAKKLKTALKDSGVKNAKIYISSSGKLVYKNVK
ncbi:MAG: leucine-rich repeat domain-containing protein [Acutalibacteraceae bacterium]